MPGSFGPYPAPAGPGPDPGAPSPGGETFEALAELLACQAGEPVSPEAAGTIRAAEESEPAGGEEKGTTQEPEAAAGSSLLWWPAAGAILAERLTAPLLPAQGDTLRPAPAGEAEADARNGLALEAASASTDPESRMDRVPGPGKLLPGTGGHDAGFAEQNGAAGLAEAAGGVCSAELPGGDPDSGGLTAPVAPPAAEDARQGKEPVRVSEPPAPSRPAGNPGHGNGQHPAPISGELRMQQAEGAQQAATGGPLGQPGPAAGQDAGSEHLLSARTQQEPSRFQPQIRSQQHSGSRGGDRLRAESGARAPEPAQARQQAETSSDAAPPLNLPPFGREAAEAEGGSAVEIHPHVQAGSEAGSFPHAPSEAPAMPAGQNRSAGTAAAAGKPESDPAGAAAEIREQALEAGSRRLLLRVDGHEGQRVDIRLLQTPGSLQVRLHSLQAGLAERMQSEAHHLERSLEAAGWKAHVGVAVAAETGRAASSGNSSAGPAVLREAGAATDAGTGAGTHSFSGGSRQEERLRGAEIREELLDLTAIRRLFRGGQPRP